MKTIDKVNQAADLLRRAWGHAEHRLVALPPELRPTDIGLAYAIQHTVSNSMGVIIGWKIVAAEPDTLLCAALPLPLLRRQGARIPWREWPTRNLRVVLCFRLGASLENYDAPYSVQQAASAIESCHVGAEAIQSRFQSEPPPSDLSFIADSLSCGPFVTGVGMYDWQRLNLDRLPTRVLVNRREVLRRDGRTELDIARTLQWLAYLGAPRTQRPLVGQMIQIGLHIDPISIPAGALVRVEIDGVGDVTLQAGDDVPRS